jgi:cyclopropane fatty-acyl-phospholipid synthase-like methyltransferase
MNIQSRAKRTRVTLNKIVRSLRENWFYRTMPYIDAYRQHTDLRVEEDPQSAVGGRWERMGSLQLNFLLSKGLNPTHRLLDIGCGTLRGGIYFIQYLEAGKYAGIELSPKALEYGACLLEREGLSHKRAELILSPDGNLRFGQLHGEFDSLLAQSVFTHLPHGYIEECFAHVRKVMKPTATFYFTAYIAQGAHQQGRKTFHYPVALFESLARRHGFELNDHSADYVHPSGQRMMSICPLASG